MDAATAAAAAAAAPTFAIEAAGYYRTDGRGRGGQPKGGARRFHTTTYDDYLNQLRARRR